MKKERLDVLLTERGLVETRSLAQRLVMAGQVRVDGQVVSKPAVKVLANAMLEIDHGPRFVSRGGEKLEGALQAFGLIDLQGQVCADVGASTGGFTDALLQHGAEKVYAIDVGYGVLHWKLRSHPRVVSMERTNARYVTTLPEPMQFATVDASFISLKILLPVVSGWFSPEGGQVVALIKPQFEAGRQDAAKGEGVIRDPQCTARC
jgi:23S rRNA (cytidine1920-2'-O)/16S rRNA (cytidine1409-2'-O)-methyltransferase